MRKDPAELLKDALALPPEGRAALADSLFESLDQEVDEGSEQAWLDEIQKRLREIDTGAVAMIPNTPNLDRNDRGRRGLPTTNFGTSAQTSWMLA